MVKGWSIALGLGLAVLGLTALSFPQQSDWLGWADCVAALAALSYGVFAQPHRSRTFQTGGPMSLAIGLFTLWIAGLVLANVPGWLPWWNFAFACAFLLLGVAGYADAAAAAAAHVDREEKEKKRAA